MGCDLFSFVPNWCMQLFENVNIRADAVFFDYTSLRKNFTKPNLVFDVLDGFVQKLQPTQYIFIALEGVCPIIKQYLKRTDLKFNPTVGDHQELKKDKEQFIKIVQDKIKSDPTWAKPKVIFSSYQTPGEAEHKLFNFTRLLKNPTKESNFINFIISCDSDCIHLSLASHLENTYVVITNINENANEIGSIVPNDFSLKCPTVSITIFREYIYMLMTDKKGKVDAKEYNRVMDDFELLCMFRENDFIKGNGFKYEYIKKYKEFHDDGLFLTNGNKVNNMNLARFLDVCPIEYTMSEESARQQFDCICWCYKYYTSGCADFNFLIPPKTKGKETISSFLKKHPDYAPEFSQTKMPNPIQRFIFEGGPRLPQLLVDRLKRFKGEPVFQNAKEIIEIAEKTYDELDEKLQQNFKIQKPFLITAEECKVIGRNDYVINQKTEKQFIDSLWNFDVKFDIDIDQKILNVKDDRTITIDEAKELIGKNVLIRWPQVQIGKVGRIMIENKIIEDNLEVHDIPDDYQQEDIKMDFVRKQNIECENKSSIYFYVRPYESQSISMRIFRYRTLYKIVPLDLILFIKDDHPIYLNYRPIEFETGKTISEEESVFIPSLKVHGVVESIDQEQNKVLVNYKITKSICIFTKEEYQYIKKQELIDANVFESLEEITYYIEKAGFKQSYFKCNEDSIPSNLVPILKAAKNKTPQLSPYSLDENSFQSNEDLQTLPPIFDLNEILWRGSKIQHPTNQVIRVGSRVAFIGKASSIPFGLIGTVYHIYDNTPCVEVMSDTEFELGLYCETKKVLFKARLYDLIVL